MVDTPWGDSSKLHDQKLPPGRGTPVEVVRENQRRRLFAALVAVVEAKGYERANVADLLTLSGVSRRAFYELFSSKQGCLLEAVEALIKMTIVPVLSAIDKPPGMERVAEAFGAFFESVAAQPAAARMFLIDTYAAGPEALAPIERAMSGFELLVRDTVVESPGRAEMPPEMIRAFVGAMVEIARTRLLQSTQAELPGLMGELREMAHSYRPPPAPLSVASRPRAPRPASLDTRDHAERALRAFTAVVAEQGYANTTIDQVVRRASMSGSTFYAHFNSKDDVMMAIIDRAGAQMVAATLAAFWRGSDWPHGVRRGLAALLNYLALRPALARLIVIEVYAAGPLAMECRAKAFGPLQRLVKKGRERSPETPAIATEMIADGILALVYQQTRDSGPERLPALVPICTYIALAPFIGADEACVAAKGDGRG